MKNVSVASIRARHGGAVSATPRAARSNQVYATVVMLLASAAASTMAMAQDSESTELAEVSVTGSRIVRDGYEAPAPTTVVGAEALQSSGTPNVADFVNTIPAFAGSRSPATTNSSMSGGSSGMNAVNLRNLGLNRTLVLLDGRRVVGSTSDNIVDINLFPQNLISRVDVFTGGASAAYGSDAVAGAVNFILDTKFTGFKGDVSGGITDFGDNETWDANIAFGTGFADGRGHVIFSAQANSVAGIEVNDRPWNMQGWQFMTNPAYGTGQGQSRTVPERILVDHVSVSNGIAGGIVTAGPLKGTAFGEGGTPYQFTYGNLVRDPDMSGGDWRSATIRGTDLANGLTSSQDTQNAFLRGSFAITDNVEIYGQAMWAHNENHNWCCAKEDNASITISNQNPFIPAATLALMNTNNVTSLTMGTMNQDLPRQGASNDRTTKMFSFGGTGSFELASKDWKWEAYAQRGESQAFQEATGIVLRSRFTKALDAVRNNTTGQIVCRVNNDGVTTNDDPLCVPYNIFGIGVNGSAAVDYLTGNGQRDFRDEKFTQDIVAFSVNAEPVELWAGPVSIAFGGEHRKDEISGVNDPFSQAGDWYIGNYKVFSADNKVTEGFLETVIPLVKDLPFAEKADFNGAVRFTDYQNSGSVTTWKAGLTYTPIEDVTLRGMRSRDIRAPNLFELYNAGAGGFPGIINPFRAGISELTQTSTLGNPDLVPEESDYTGAGIVFQPRFVPGLSASIDYWNLDIEKAIGTITAQQTIDGCFAGNSTYCDAITFGAGNIIDMIRVQPYNLAQLIARGVDYEASYRLPMELPLVGGNLTFRALATNFKKNFATNGLGDTAGQNTGSGPPSWRWNASLVYSGPQVTGSLTARGISAGTYLNTNIECTSGCPTSNAINRTVDNNRISGSIYLDASVGYRFGEDVVSELYFNVRNLTNKDPVIVGPGPGGFAYESPAANATLYDTLGRTYRLGFRVRM